MQFAKQELPDEPTLPDAKVRKLRAALIFEEAMETISALGVDIVMHVDTNMYVGGDSKRRYFLLNQAHPDGHGTVVSHEYQASAPGNLQLIADGCADVSVVTVGTLSACGIADTPVLEAVDQNNLDKSGPGHTWRKDGKLIKPPGHPEPALKEALEQQFVGLTAEVSSDGY